MASTQGWAEKQVPCIEGVCKPLRTSARVMSFPCSQEEYTVMLGDNVLNSESENATLVPVQDIVYPSNFDSQTMKSDIALALLATPVNYSSLIQPVCLPGKPFQVKNGTLCWVTGWGHQRENGEPGRRDADGTAWCSRVGQ